MSSSTSTDEQIVVYPNSCKIQLRRSVTEGTEKLLGGVAILIGVIALLMYTDVRLHQSHIFNRFSLLFTVTC